LGIWVSRRRLCHSSGSICFKGIDKVGEVLLLEREVLANGAELAAEGLLEVLMGEADSNGLSHQSES